MKTFLADLLVCPDCAGRERPLCLTAHDARHGDVVSGRLDCAGCGGRHLIQDGVAQVLPRSAESAPPSQRRYDTASALSSYLWAHYGDLAGLPGAGTLFRTLAPSIQGGRGPLLDAGAAVGRMVFETAGRASPAVGLDLSPALVRAARTLLTEGELTFDLVTEGRITETVRIEAPAHWAGLDADFLVADAQALPFASSVFGSVCSLNLLDKIPQPLDHLRELDRVAKAESAELLIADPFSWSEDAAEPGRWLGGRNNGPFAGRGSDNVRRLLCEEGELPGPAWTTPATGAAEWTLRTHANHREVITSQYLHARR
ncbi:MAG: methyltransferase domain-containing protein [Desulfovibrionaceae bacterium]